VTEVDDGFAVTNGIATSPDGNTAYVSDMFHRRIRVYRLDPESGAIIERLPAITTQGPGYPDGLAVDSDGRLWVGYWEGSRVDCIDAGGALITSVSVPAGHATRACLGGHDGSQLFVTSARYNLDDAQLRAQPSSGALFSATVDGVGLPPAEARL
jgi:D-xylonolactonase